MLVFNVFALGGSNLDRRTWDCRTSGGAVIMALETDPPFFIDEVCRYF